MVMNTRGLRIGMRTATPILGNQENAQSTHSHNSNSLSLDSGSQPWFQQFPVSIDNDSTDNTCIEGFLSNYERANASTSIYATNYGHLWRGHGF